ncbi:MAG TPA: hypothetical protein VG318_08160, partial [Actinomycetota bacterium]|nr:hypothetical protein [Actinomycetota bacterium]
HGGRCVAGLSLDAPRFVRPVGEAPHTELHIRHCGVEGRQPRLFEVVEFEHLGHDGDVAQPENVLLAEQPWRLLGRMPGDEALSRLRAVRHAPPRIFGNFGKAVHVDDAADGVDASLAVVEPHDLEFEHRADATARVHFIHAGRTWDLGLTDFPIHKAVMEADVGRHRPSDLGLPRTILLTLSLGTAFGEFHHKLVAAVLPFE